MLLFKSQIQQTVWLKYTPVNCNGCLHCVDSTDFYVHTCCHSLVNCDFKAAANLCRNFQHFL